MFHINKLEREYLMHLNWINLASNPCRLDSSTGQVADRYPEGANSNPTLVNIFQLTSTVSEYHEKYFGFLNKSKARTNTVDMILTFSCLTITGEKFQEEATC